ncbi:MAG: hypothetical protein KY469_01975 [Actinobacteria bacterium]|nr:hypothetical protein [Actinomycetota bacterium]
MRRHLRVALGACGVAAVVYLVPVLAAYGFADVPARLLVGDPSEVAGLPYYIGVISNVGALAWGMGAAVALFAGWIAVRTHERATGRFLIATGAVTLLLVLDDLLQLHDGLFDTELGVPEEVAYAALGALFVAYAWRFRDHLWDPTNRGWVLVAVGLFAVSLVIDLAEPKIRGALVVEELAKFLGIAAWTAGMVTVSRDALIGEWNGASR